jgi:glucose-6-phosphate dehydrogenase assembly protein OpcA
MAAPVNGEASPGHTAWDGTGVGIGDITAQLAAQRQPPGGGPPYTLSGVLNLVAYAPTAGELGPMQQVIEGLADHQASRTIVIVESAEGSGLDASVSTSCRLTGDHVGVVHEHLVLTIRGETRQGEASAAMPLLRSELPTVLWWPGPPEPARAGSLAALAALADRVVTEAGQARDAGAAVRALAAWVAGRAGAAVTDLAWAAITAWRQLIVQILDPSALRAMGPEARATVVHSAPAPDARTLLMAGWLRDLLGSGTTVVLRPRDGADAGLLGVELAAPDGHRISVERLPGRDAATVVTTGPDGAVRERTLPLPDPGRARLLAGELEIQRRDRAFERALAMVPL